MNQQELISVIIPVYKVEQTLPACMDSVLAQTYRNLEVILVDDGSPDNCGAICDEYAARDPRVRVIHQKNGGASAARNTGLDAARGAYIGFVDPDDYIEPDMYRLLYKRLQETGADIAQCGYTRHEETGEIWNAFGSGENGAVYDGAQCVEKMLTEFAPWWTNTTRLCRTELFKTRRFSEELRSCEDMLMNTQLFLASRRVVFIKEPLYHWIYRPGSLTTFRVYTCVDAVKSAGLIWREIEERLPRLSGTGCRHFTNNAVSSHEDLWLYRDKCGRQAREEAAAFVLDAFRKARPTILKTPEISRTLKIKTCLITLTPRLYDFLLPVWLKTAKWRGKKRPRKTAAGEK